MVVMVTLDGGGGWPMVSLYYPHILFDYSLIRGGSEVRRASTVDVVDLFSSKIVLG